MGLIADIHKDLERGAFQLIVEYRARLHFEALNLCKDKSLADDLVFRTFERVLAKADAYKVDTNLFGWMKSIMENLYRDDMRRPVVSGTRALADDELEQCVGADWCTDEQILKNSDSEAIRKAISELDPKYNQVLLMRYYDGFSLKQIANFLRIPQGTVSWRLHVAHRLLAGKLEVMLGRTKKPLAVLAAVLTFTFAAAAVATVPALAPVRDAVAAWFAEADRGTGVSPVQSETVSEPEQEDSTPTQPNTTETTKGETMNINKIAAVATATLLGMAANAAESTTSLFTQKDAPGSWGDSGNWDVAPHELTEIIKFKLNDGSPLGAYLKDGDNFSYANAALTVGCDSRNPSDAITTATLAITNAALTVKSMAVGSAGVTGVVEIVGGTLTGSSAITIGTTSGGDGILKVKNGTIGTLDTFGGSARAVLEADHSVVNVKSGWKCGWGSKDNYVLLKNGSTLNASGGISIGCNGTVGVKADMYMEDSQVDAPGHMQFAFANSCKLFMTNSTIKVRQESLAGTTANTTHLKGKKIAEIQQIGASTNYCDWTNTQGNEGRVGLYGNFRYLMDGEKAYLKCLMLQLAGKSAAVTQSFDLVSGEVEINGASGLQFVGTDSTKFFNFRGGKISLLSASNPGISQTGTGDAVFSMHGSAPQITVSKIDAIADNPLLMKFVIDRTGAPCIKFSYPNTASYRILRGAYVAKLDGGLQILHTNEFAFVDTRGTGKTGNIVAAAESTTAGDPAKYADLNEAEQHLWTFGPYGTTTNPTGVFAGKKCFGAELNADAELEIGKRYEKGRSCGWVKLSKFKSESASCRVRLDIEPQNGHTLAEIADGLTAAGYPAKVISGGVYNLRVTIPSEDIRIGSENEVVAFDFAEYDSGEAVKTLTPTDVRALVYQADVVQQPGLLILLK